jgi:hypothetical protein
MSFNNTKAGVSTAMGSTNKSFTNVINKNLEEEK